MDQAPSPVNPRQTNPFPWIVCTLLFSGSVVGCSAAHPLKGVPAAQTSWENRAFERSGRDTLDLTLLAQSPPAEHLVDTGDTLGIYIDGVLGSCQCEQAIPVYQPSDRELSPSTGFPIPVRSDGTISLPLSSPLFVRGMSLVQVEDLIRRTYTIDKPVLQPGRDRILVSLQKPRSVRVLVIRQEATQGLGVTGSSDAAADQKDKRGTGRMVILPAYRNDVLNALTETGGLPGVDAQNTIYVIRRSGVGAPACHTTGLTGDSNGKPKGNIQQTSATSELYGHSEAPGMPREGMGPAGPDGGSANWNAGPLIAGGWNLGDPTIRNQRVTKIPMKLAPNQPACFGPADVILGDGDVVFIESREPDFFYTGGLLGSNQHELPRDYDLNVLDAIAVAEGRASSKSFNYPPNKAIGGVSALNQDISVGASKVIVQRTMPNGCVVNLEVDLHKALRDPSERVMIRPGDRLILRYTRCEAVAAFFERHILEGLVIGASSGLVFGN